MKPPKKEAYDVLWLSEDDLIDGLIRGRSRRWATSRRGWTQFKESTNTLSDW